MGRCYLGATLKGTWSTDASTSGWGHCLVLGLLTGLALTGYMLLGGTDMAGRWVLVGAGMMGLVVTFGVLVGPLGRST